MFLVQRRTASPRARHAVIVETRVALARGKERNIPETGKGTSRTDASARPAPPVRGRRWRRVLVVVSLLGVAGIGGYELWQWAVVPAGAPVIGVSLDTAWHSRWGLTSQSYDLALTRVGARTHNIRPGDATADEILDSIDALLLTGGGDVDPALYGGDPAAAQLVDRGRDDLEIALIRGALRRDMPILGICRGIQILNVAQGGDLRDLRRDKVLADAHGIDLDSLDAHDVDITPGSRLAEIVGAERKAVNSFHGQAVGRLADKLHAVARSADGVIEAVEQPDRRFVVAIQWHPEILSVNDAAELALFKRLVEKAREYRRQE